MTPHFSDKKAATRYLQENQDTKPFQCPFLLVVNTDIDISGNSYEKDELMCSCGFLDMCVAFNSVKMDRDGNLEVKCRRHPAGRAFVFRNEPPT